MKLYLLYLIIEKMQYNYFGNFIRRKRLGLNYTLNKFAIECELEPATLSNFERQNSDLYFSNFIKLAKGFKVSPSELLAEYEKSYK